MKKVLFISSRPIYPIVSGGQIRTAQQLEFLSQRYEVDVIFQTEKFIEAERFIRQYLTSIGKVVCFRLPRWKCYLNTLRFLFNRLPLQVNYYYDCRIKQYVKEHQEEYDFVFCNNIRTTEYIRELKGITKIVDFVDAISMNYEKAKGYAHGIKKIIYTIDHKRCLKYEQCVLSSFDRCCIISEIDKQYILKCRQKYTL